MKHPRKEVSPHSPYSGRRCPITGRDVQSGDTIIVCPDTDVAYLEHAFREHLKHTPLCPACKKEAMIPPPISAKPPPKGDPAPEYTPPSSPRSGMAMAQVALVAGGVALLTICVVLVALVGLGGLNNNTASTSNTQTGNDAEDASASPREVVTVIVTQSTEPTDPPTSEPTPEPQVTREEVTVVVTQTPVPTDPPPSPTLRPSVVQPFILARSSWGAAAPGGGMARHTPERIVFTHEGGSRCCDGVDPSSRIRGNQGIHMDSVGWPDLAFHYIVAPNGAIYDGRNDDFQSDSSYARINSDYQLDGTLVVGILGNYDIQNPTSTSLAAAEELIAWLCQEYDISSSKVYYLRDLAPKDVSGGSTTSPGASMPSIQQFRNNIEAILGK